jgi:hypothetical protein
VENDSCVEAVFTWAVEAWAVAAVGGGAPSITRLDDIVAAGFLKYFSGSALNFSAQAAQQK